MILSPCIFVIINWIIGALERVLQFICITVMITVLRVDLMVMQ